jgi:hypothetical protein
VEIDDSGIKTVTENKMYRTQSGLTDSGRGNSDSEVSGIDGPFDLFGGYSHEVPD